MHRETDKILFTLGADDILYIECQPNTKMTIKEAKESTLIGGELLNHTPHPLLCDLTNVTKMTHECRKHFAGSEHAAIFSKCALIVTSPISRVIGNFFLGANKPIKPTRLFTSKEEGLKWLKNKDSI
ncbi:MAG: STAS/SEC14 domain-containing protein [Marivirga sp.]|nr:STAS/SEC14 domain-containing protein [Marivirga sp.]